MDGKQEINLEWPNRLHFFSIPCTQANGENIDTELKEDHVESTCTAINKLESVLDKFKSELKGRERAVAHSDSFDVKVGTC